MTAEKILNTLELCALGLCEYCDRKNEQEMCRESLNVDIATLIKNQKAEIERLKAEQQNYKDFLLPIMEAREDIKAEAIKEFAHRLKILMETKAVLLNLRNDFAYSDDCVFAIVQSTALSTIDNLVKEMVGNSNA